MRQISKNKFLKKLEKIQYGSLKIETYEGEKYLFKGDIPGEDIDLKINNWVFVPQLLASGGIGFTKSYINGHVETSNLHTFLTFALRNSQILDSYIYGSFFSRIVHKFIYFLNTNTIRQSKKNIHQHYDLGNDFYSLWLDQSMTYSSGIFQSDSNSLFDAQINKYNRILNNINHSGTLLEIGCGWGGFLNHALHYKDFHAKGITISHKQLEYARNKLNGKADICLEDYRHQKGKFDNVVSIEMFEAVGKKYWPIYFRKIKELLSAQGKAMIQTITINEDISSQYQAGTDMIRSFIFPGGMLPSESQFRYHAHQNGLKITNIYRFGRDYSKTLDLWAKNFNTNIEAIKKLQFDNKFIKLWNFYLASCSSCFLLGRTNVIQVRIEHE